jgi:cell wall-associated NlpC family hydrolase
VATSRIIFTPPGDEERIRRAAVVEARTWLRTPYHHWAEMKHVGVDCAHLVLAVYRSVGLDFGAAKPGYVHPQWFQSASPPELLLNAGRMFAAEVPGPPERLPKPADLVFFRLKSKVFNHVGLVDVWPKVIHARPHGVLGVGGIVEMGTVGEELLRVKHLKIFSVW